MSLFGSLLRFQITKWIKYFRTRTLAKLITSTLFLIVFGFVAVGIYSFFVSGFLYIELQVEPDVRQAVTLFIYEMFLLMLGALIVFGALISGMFSLFRSENNNWLLASPKFSLWPRIVLAKTVTNAILPTLILFLPALFAYSHAYKIMIMRRLPVEGLVALTPTSLFLIGVTITACIVTLSALTLSFITLLGAIYRWVAIRTKVIHFTFGRFMSLLFFAVVLLGISVWSEVRSVDLVRIFKAYETSATIDIATIGDHFIYSPTHYLSLLLVHAETGVSYTYECVLSVILAIISVVIWLIVLRLHLPLWQALQENYSKKDKERSTRSSYQFIGSTTMVLFKKEALITERNLKGIAWFLFLFGIWVIQIGTNKILGRNIIRYDPDINHKLIVLQAIESVIALYFISSFALRFIFPSLSIEKKTAWILKSAPLDFKKIFFGKYLFYTLSFLILGVFMSYVSQIALSLPLVNGVYGVGTFMIAVLFIVTLALSFGVIFPSTESDDPESITTSLGGLLFTALSLLYGALSSYTLYQALLHNSYELIIAYTFGSAALIGVLILVGLSKGFPDLDR